MKRTYARSSMLRIDIWPEARDCLESLPGKYRRQISAKIFSLAADPLLPRSKLLEGHAPFRRYRSGDYRIVYFVDKDVLKVPLIDKRGDDRVYRRLKQMFR